MVGAYTHCSSQMLYAKKSSASLGKTLYGILSWTTFPALAGKCSGCSRFPSGTLVPSALSWPFGSADTADLSHALQTKLSSQPERLLIFSTDTKTEHSGRLPMNGFINCQSHRETTTCCSTALLWLLTHPVNLLAWLVLWKMWALPAFPRVSNNAGTLQPRQYTAL